MPTYDYACRFCEHKFEHFQGINDPLKRKCPECGRMGLDRLFGTGIGVVFKGSGFYETDYKRAPNKDGEKKSAKSAESTAKDGATAKPKAEKTNGNKTGDPSREN